MESASSRTDSGSIVKRATSVGRSISSILICLIASPFADTMFHLLYPERILVQLIQLDVFGFPQRHFLDQMLRHDDAAAVTIPVQFTDYRRAVGH